MEEAEEVFQAAENAGTPDHHPVSPVKVLTAVTGDRSFKLSSSLQGRKRGASLPQVHK